MTKKYPLASDFSNGDKAIRSVNLYPLYSAVRFVGTYPLNSDISGGQRYPPLEQLGPRALRVTNLLLINKFQENNFAVGVAITANIGKFQKQTGSHELSEGRN